MNGYFSGEGPICPYCERQYTADEPCYFDESNFTKMECDDCGRTFAVIVAHSVSWATGPIASQPSQEQS